MSQKSTPIGVALNGSTYQASRSGFRIMSLSLIAFQPAIEEPSNIRPSVSSSSPSTPEHMVRCCHLPLGSVNRRSTHSIPPSVIAFRMVPALFAMRIAPLIGNPDGELHPGAAPGRPAAGEYFTWERSERAPLRRDQHPEQH